MRLLVRRLKAKAWLLVGYESKCQGEVLPFLICLRNNQMFSFSFWLVMQPNVKVRGSGGDARKMAKGQILWKIWGGSFKNDTVKRKDAIFFVC